MKASLSSVSLLSASLLSSQISANAIRPVEARAIELYERATPQAPNGYTPTEVDCPSDRPTIRSAIGLSDQETEWLQRRRNNTIDPLKELLGRLGIEGYDINAFIDNNRNNATALPNIGLAFSGGGYRALLNGAGVLAAFDSRTDNSTSSGHIGGLLQASTYIAGLSGGSWLVGSIYTNNFTSVQNIMNQNPDSSSLWQFENSILVGPEQGDIQILSTADYYANIQQSISGKADAGFNTSITDYWSRALAYQLVNAPEGGPGYTFSSIADDDDFSNANAPMPIIVADERDPGARLLSINTTVFEFNPWEMGSFDPTLYAFAPLRYVGSRFDGGQLPNDARCVRGFDNAAYIMGTSSSLFNQVALQFSNESIDAPQFLKDALASITNGLGEDNNDIADWTPNPFFGFNSDFNPNAESQRLTLVDGGEDLQNIPLHPLIQPYRGVDVIFAVDSSADTVGDDETSANWPNGTALVATYERSLNETLGNGTAFPVIPDQNTFVNLGLNNRPTFFGCDATNTSTITPLVVYIPNSPYVFNSNISTFDPDYNSTERNAIIANGYQVATRGNSTQDPEWPQCVACAIMSRSWFKTGEQVPERCNQCFQRYCWDGTLNSADANYQPSSVFEQIDVSAGALVGPRASLLAAAVLAAVMMLL